MTEEEKKEPVKGYKKVSEMTPEEQKAYFADSPDLWGREFCTEFIRSCNHVVDKDGNEISRDRPKRKKKESGESPE